MTSRGNFEVTLAPLEGYSTGGDGIRLGRMSIDKQFHGGLEAVSKGEMLSAISSVKGSAGYVAIEQVTGTLEGRAGSFVLQHFGTLNRGIDRLVLEVVPDSGTGQLSGLSGSMAIIIDGGRHSYQFDYELPDSKTDRLDV
ncbi:MAG: DUF3224 domain-containing protein [Ignavibacteriae bacterium]|nr:DUF3224 domain-containing protein [Ignavibacteriota bacterium]